MSAFLVQNSEDGGHTVEVQGDAYVTGQFYLEAAWDSVEGGRPEVSETWEEFEIEVSPQKSRAQTRTWTTSSDTRGCDRSPAEEGRLRQVLTQKPTARTA